jgi:hypothetical protein
VAARAVAEADLLGHDLVLAMLPAIFRDYVLNVDGPPAQAIVL